MLLRAGACLFELSRFDEAWRMYEQALPAMNSGYAQVPSHYRAGLAAWRAGYGDEAERLLRQALWLDPLHDLAVDAAVLASRTNR